MNSMETASEGIVPVQSNPSGMPRSVTILGSTGSVGTQTVDLLRADPKGGEPRFRALFARSPCRAQAA